MGVPDLSFDEYVAAGEAGLRAEDPNLTTARVTIAGRTFARAEWFGKHSRAGSEPVHQRALTALRQPAGYVFCFASADPAADAELLDRMEASVRLV